LTTLCFDLVVEHPYDSILKTCKNLPFIEDKKSLIAQYAWNFVNDSLSTTIVLEFRPQMIALSSLYLAAKTNKIDLEWKTHLGVDESNIPAHYEIMNRIFSIYEKQKPTDAGSQTPNLSKAIQPAVNHALSPASHNPSPKPQHPDTEKKEKEPETALSSPHRLPWQWPIRFTLLILPLPLPLLY